MATPVRRPTTRAAQSLADKLIAIGARSPADLAAFSVLADEVLRRLDAQAAEKARRSGAIAGISPGRSTR